MGMTVAEDDPLFLLRWFYSIDFPIRHIVIITGGKGKHVKDELQHIEAQGESCSLYFQHESETLQEPQSFVCTPAAPFSREDVHSKSPQCLV